MIDKEVIVVIEKIMKIIKYETNDTSINIDPLNEITFLQLLNNIKKMIKDLISKYKIKQMRYNEKIFDQLLLEYKTFDLTNLNKFSLD